MDDREAERLRDPHRRDDVLEQQVVVDRPDTGDL
jgi:hypothetical protein